MLLCFRSDVEVTITFGPHFLSGHWHLLVATAAFVVVANFAEAVKALVDESRASSKASPWSTLAFHDMFLQDNRNKT